MKLDKHKFILGDVRKLERIDLLDTELGKTMAEFASKIALETDNTITGYISAAMPEYIEDEGLVYRYKFNMHKIADAIKRDIEHEEVEKKLKQYEKALDKACDMLALGYDYPGGYMEFWEVDEWKEWCLMGKSELIEEARVYADYYGRYSDGDTTVPFSMYKLRELADSLERYVKALDKACELLAKNDLFLTAEQWKENLLNENK